MAQPLSNPSRPNLRRARRQIAKGSTKARAFRNWLGLGPNIGVRVLDISETGVRLVVSEEMALGREFELELEGPGSRPLKMLANVVWCIKTENGGYCIGACFQKVLPYATLGALTRP